MAGQDVREVVFVEKRGHKPTIKKVGREPGLVVTEENAGKVVKFYGEKKNLAIYTDKVQIIFSDHTFETDNKSDIEMIKKHPAFGMAIWEGAFPADFVQKMKLDQSMMSRNEESFIPADATTM